MTIVVCSIHWLEICRLPRSLNLFLMEGTVEIYNQTVRQRWKHLCRRLYHQARQAVVLLHRAHRLGVMKTDDYKFIMDDKTNATDDVKEKGTKGRKSSKGKSSPMTAARTKAAPKTAPASSRSATEVYQSQVRTECPHPAFKRHGNRHGSFATCTQCMGRWRWDGVGWRQHGSSSKLSLPQPSFLTVADGSIKPPGYQRGGVPSFGRSRIPRASASTTFADEANPGSSDSLIPDAPDTIAHSGIHRGNDSTQALRQNKTGTTRSRPPSMTSSAAGHAKTVDQMADMDQELDFEELEEVQSIYSWPPDDESD